MDSQNDNGTMLQTFGVNGNSNPASQQHIESHEIVTSDHITSNGAAAPSSNGIPTALTSETLIPSMDVAAGAMATQHPHQQQTQQQLQSQHQSQLEQAHLEVPVTTTENSASGSNLLDNTAQGSEQHNPNQLQEQELPAVSDASNMKTVGTGNENGTLPADIQYNQPQMTEGVKNVTVPKGLGVTIGNEEADGDQGETEVNTSPNLDLGGSNLNVQDGCHASSELTGTIPNLTKATKSGDGHEQSFGVGADQGQTGGNSGLVVNESGSVSSAPLTEVNAMASLPLQTPHSEALVRSKVEEAIQPAQGIENTQSGMVVDTQDVNPSSGLQTVQMVTSSQGGPNALAGDGTHLVQGSHGMQAVQGMHMVPGTSMHAMGGVQAPQMIQTAGGMHVPGMPAIGGMQAVQGVPGIEGMQGFQGMVVQGVPGMHGMQGMQAVHTVAGIDGKGSAMITKEGMNVQPGVVSRMMSVGSMAKKSTRMPGTKHCPTCQNTIAAAVAKCPKCPHVFREKKEKVKRSGKRGKKNCPKCNYENPSACSSCKQCKYVFRLKLMDKYKAMRPARAINESAAAAAVHAAVNLHSQQQAAALAAAAAGHQMPNIGTMAMPNSVGVSGVGVSGVNVNTSQYAPNQIGQAMHAAAAAAHGVPVMTPMAVAHTIGLPQQSHPLHAASMAQLQHQIPQHSMQAQHQGHPQM